MGDVGDIGVGPTWPNIWGIIGRYPPGGELLGRFLGMCVKGAALLSYGPKIRKNKKNRLIPVSSVGLTLK